MKRRLVLVSLITIVGFGLFFVSCGKDFAGCKCVSSVGSVTHHSHSDVIGTGADDCDEFENKMNAGLYGFSVSCTEY